MAKASDIRGWLPALGMRPLELVRAAAVIWGAHIAVTAHGSVGKFMFSFNFLSLARILKTLWGVLTTKDSGGIVQASSILRLGFRSLR